MTARRKRFPMFPPERFLTILLGFSFLIGCGDNAPQGPTLVTATGQVLLDDEPLADADLMFVPIGTTEGIGGRARTDASGLFQADYARGGIGLPTGTYRVTVSKRVMPDGSAVPADDETPPIESPAQETLPAKYSDENSTTLEVSVAADKLIELKLKKE